MDSFERRRKSAEAKYAVDQGHAFKAQARANKALGLWVAEQLDMPPEKAAAYALDVVRSDFEEPGFEDVMRKVMADLGPRVTEETIRDKAEELYLEALEQIKNE